MIWIAPSEKDTANGTLEKRLWDTADQFRANSGLKAQEYSGPILGIIFLRFAEVRFAQQRAKLEKASASSRRGSRVDEPAAYHAEGILYLAPNARFDFLLNLPEARDIGTKVNDAMRDIEKHNPQLAGVLPKTYNLFTSTLLKELLKKVSEIPVTVDYDAFGRIYEYFLGEFARTEGQKGGEFYTPSCIVRLLTEVIEPYHGCILDPACGSGGMFVSSARFVSEHKKNPSAELSIHGVEKTDETGRLCRLNLAVHGLEGDIRHGGQVNSYYDDPHDATGRFDFVLANPPFNVNAVDKERLKDMVGANRRFAFGLPRTDNANYLWIQLFHSALNAKGRAGFVMANSASDARASEQEIRQKLIEGRAVDVMVAVGPNMFYTVTLPCTLWFFDKGKANTPRKDTVLFVDARHIYRQVDRAHREWTPVQIGFLANLVRLYRGEDPDYTLGGDDVRAKLEEIFGKKPKFADVPGLCRAANVELKGQGAEVKPIELRYRFNLKAFREAMIEYVAGAIGLVEARAARPDYVENKLREIDFAALGDRGATVNKIPDEDGVYAKTLREFFAQEVNFETLKLQAELRLLDVRKLGQIYVLYDDKPVENSSFGQRCTAVIVVLLLLGNMPIVIDEPEAHLDSSLIAKYLVDLIKTRKKHRQIIFATHNANFVINGDAELIHCMSMDDAKVTEVVSTTIEDLANRELLLALEGGEKAFHQREKRYGID